MTSTARRLRELILRESHRAHVGHIGSCLSIAELVAVLFDDILRGIGADDPNRDRFVLAKGHAVLTLYAALHERKVISSEELASYCADGSRYGSHPDHRARGIELSTGSLGLALSVCAGMALGARMKGIGSRVFVLMSDAEMNEGSVWEAAAFVAHHRVHNLIAIVDCNGQQALGATKDIVDFEPLAAKWRAFGWNVHEVDGHDAHALRVAMTEGLSPQLPTAVLARTVLGKGVSFMERQLQWHYYPIDDAQLSQSLREIGSEA